jgi:hypothetical protein
MRDDKLSGYTVPVLQLVIGCLVVATWGWVNHSIFSGSLVLQGTMESVANRALGILDGALLLVLYFTFGSSLRSQSKDQVIRNLSE